MRTFPSSFGVSLPLLLALVGGCAARGHASASTASDATLAPDFDSRGDAAVAPSKQKSKDSAHQASQHGAGGAAAKDEPPLKKPPEPPRYDPKAVREAIDRTATPVDEQRPRLGLRFAVVDQGPDAPWLLAIVNRGTEPVRVAPDLRTLQLEITPPSPPPDESKPARWKPAPKPVTCALPRELVPQEEDARLTYTLAPGEGLVDSFDPRLYCLSSKEKSLLKPEASVVARIGWPEKTRPVWRKGKRELIVLEQTAPFLAHREVPEGSLPEAPEEEAPSAKQGAPEPGEPPHSDSDAIKLLLAPAVSLGAAYAAEPAHDAEALSLQLARGSDARTEADATVTLSLVNHGKKKERVFFRRELVSFEISGPQGIVACQPGPDSRAPDRGAISTLRPGGRVSATSRLIELCPEGTLRTPGLYLVHARFDSIDERDPSAPPMFEGRLVSQAPVAIRVRRGWGELPAQREPERVQIGTP